MDVYIGVLHILLRKTLLKKGFSSNSFPKTFSLNFSPIGIYPMGLKFILKVFGRGHGG